jgi:hypothetical protein
MALVAGAVGSKHARHAGMQIEELAATKNRPMTTIGG